MAFGFYAIILLTGMLVHLRRVEFGRVYPLLYWMMKHDAVDACFVVPESRFSPRCLREGAIAFELGPRLGVKNKISRWDAPTSMLLVALI